MVRQNSPECTATTLHLLAMVTMLCDHMGLTLFPGLLWMRCVGRIAFPIFAFLLVEGYFHTRSLPRYALRLLLFALLSEIPFDLMVSGRIYAPWSQNVLWTLLMGLGLIFLLEQVKRAKNLWLRLLGVGFSVLLAAILGEILSADYGSAGLFTILVFYCFRGRQWYHFLGQFLGLAYIHTRLLSSHILILPVAGLSVPLPMQTLAALALIPLWLYRGNSGHKSKALRTVYYFFYPAHMFILSLLRVILHP